MTVANDCCARVPKSTKQPLKNDSFIDFIHSHCCTLSVSYIARIFFRECIVTTNNIAELVVGFETTSLEVSESAGKVELCAKISQPSTAPVEIEFNLTVQLHAGTAG